MWLKRRLGGLGIQLSVWKHGCSTGDKQNAHCMGERRNEILWRWVQPGLLDKYLVPVRLYPASPKPSPRIPHGYR
jgi:hypothetical protein